MRNNIISYFNDWHLFPGGWSFEASAIIRSAPYTSPRVARAARALRTRKKTRRDCPTSERRRGGPKGAPGPRRRCCSAIDPPEPSWSGPTAQASTPCRSRAMTMCTTASSTRRTRGMGSQSRTTSTGPWRRWWCTMRPTRWKCTMTRWPPSCCTLSLHWTPVRCCPATWEVCGLRKSRDVDLSALIRD